MDSDSDEPHESDPEQEVPTTRRRGPKIARRSAQLKAKFENLEPEEQAVFVQRAQALKEKALADIPKDEVHSET